MRTRDQLRRDIDTAIDTDRNKVLTAHEELMSLLMQINNNLTTIKRNTARIP